MKIRCRNCGVWHETEKCNEYGPMHPAPGLTSENYRFVAAAINDRVAQDIVNEHENLDSNEEDPIVCNNSHENIGCSGDVTHEPDPYLFDLYQDSTPVWMCERHRAERADDR